MLLKELLEQIPGVTAHGNMQVPILGISFDSRRVAEGHLFVAVKGGMTDGNRFMGQAIQRGAVAVASEEAVQTEGGVAVIQVRDARRFLALAARSFYRDPAREMTIVGITGTNGKTTTTYLMDAIFRQAGLKSCLLGTLGMRIGEHGVPSKHTTPEAPDLLNFLRQAADAGCTHAVMEVSSHALALKRVFGTHIPIAVFSNLTRDHLDFHQDMESYYQSKRTLFSGEGNNGIEDAAINIDDPWGRRLAGELPCRVLRYGTRLDADVRLVEARPRVDGTDLRVAAKGAEFEIQSRLLGQPNASNVLAAISAALICGISPLEIRRGLESLSGVAGRMEPVRSGQSFAVIVDYAHTPDALERTLETLRQLPHRKLIAVFGCGGDRDRTKRPLMGEIAARLSDRVVATSDNPRGENPLKILMEIEPGLKQGPAAYSLMVDRRQAIREALWSAAAEDIVLIAGKGHEDYQILGPETVHFDDRTVAREILAELLNDSGARN